MECVLCHHLLNEKEIQAVQKRVGDSPICSSCWQGWQEHLAHERALEQSYKKARARRVAKVQKEHDEWRQQRYEQRIIELQEQQRRADEYRAASK